METQSRRKKELNLFSACRRLQFEMRTDERTGIWMNFSEKLSSFVRGDWIAQIE